MSKKGLIEHLKHHEKTDVYSQSSEHFWVINLEEWAENNPTLLMSNHNTWHGGGSVTSIQPDHEHAGVIQR